MLEKQIERPICIICNTNQCRLNGISKKGFIKYKKYCGSCHKTIYNLKDSGRNLGYRINKKDKCESCGFIPKHKCQLDVDHIDGDKHNNEKSNLQTLCANCHRLKTHLQLWGGN